MSTFKILLISASCGIVLLGLIAFLSTAFQRDFLISTVAIVCMPGLAIFMGYMRKNRGESRLWKALTVAGVAAPVTWFVFVLIALTYSDI
jgi:hypothetical protein